MLDKCAAPFSRKQQSLLSMESVEALLNYFQNNLWATAVAVFVLTVLALVIHGIWESYSKPLVLEASPIPCGDITIDELGKFDGTDPFKPIYVAIKGNVYDVTKGRDFYGRGEIAVDFGYIAQKSIGWIAFAPHVSVPAVSLNLMNLWHQVCAYLPSFAKVMIICW